MNASASVDACSLLRLQGENQPVCSYGEADAGSFWAADSFREAVVASATKQSILRAQSSVRELRKAVRV